MRYRVTFDDEDLEQLEPAVREAVLRLWRSGADDRPDPDVPFRGKRLQSEPLRTQAENDRLWKEAEIRPGVMSIPSLFSRSEKR